MKIKVILSLCVSKCCSTAQWYFTASKDVNLHTTFPFPLKTISSLPAYKPQDFKRQMLLHKSFCLNHILIKSNKNKPYARKKQTPLKSIPILPSLKSKLIIYRPNIQEEWSAKKHRTLIKAVHIPMKTRPKGKTYTLQRQLPFLLIVAHAKSLISLVCLNTHSINI